MFNGFVAELSIIIENDMRHATAARLLCLKQHGLVNEVNPLTPGSSIRFLRLPMIIQGYPWLSKGTKGSPGKMHAVPGSCMQLYRRMQF